MTDIDIDRYRDALGAVLNANPDDPAALLSALARAQDATAVAREVQALLAMPDPDPSEGETT